MLSSNSLRQTAHTHRASVHQVAKSVAALLRVAGLTAGLAESNGSLPPGLWLTPPASRLPRTGISSGTLIEYGIPLPFLLWHCWLHARKSIQPVKIDWWGVGVVICLERGADCLHMQARVLWLLLTQTMLMLASSTNKLAHHGPVCHALERPAKLIAHPKIDKTWQNFRSPELRTKFQRQVPLFLYISEFLKIQSRQQRPFNGLWSGTTRVGRY